MHAVLLGLALLAAPGELSPQAPPALESEGLERARFKSKVRGWIIGKKFDELESLGKSLVVDDPRYKCGVSMLVDFYNALEPDRMGPGSTGPDGMMESFRKWEEVVPTSYWPNVGRSVVEAWLGRQARGQRSAAETTAEQWKGQAAHLDAAVGWARKVQAKAPQDPGFYDYLLALCIRTGCSREEADGLVAKAIEINPQFDAVYSTMANYLLPRWHGTADEFVEFAEKTSDNNEAVGNIAYARVATVGLLVEQKNLRNVFPTLSWDRIRAGLRMIEEKYPGSTRTQGLLARFADLYGDRETAREAFLRVGDKFVPDTQSYWGLDITAFNRARQWAVGQEGAP